MIGEPDAGSGHRLIGADARQAHSLIESPPTLGASPAPGVLEALLAEFDFKETVPRVRIDLTSAHFWDITAVETLDRVVHKFRRNGVDVQVVGLNQASMTMVERDGTHDKPASTAGAPVH